MRLKYLFVLICSFLLMLGVSEAKPKTSPLPSELLDASQDLNAPRESARRVVKTRGVIDRGELTRVVKGGVPQLLAQAQLAPVRRDRRFIGFQLRSLRENSIAKKAGFMVNDIIMSINGEPIGRPEQMMHTLSLLPFAQTVVVRFERQGTIKEWTWLIGG